ncbi:MAG: hypothetical protein N2484_04060 [Clostridia bacterium]|nr:hypothetical protein [Clostridia bacterium]
MKKKNCNHDEIVYTFAVDNAERIAGTKVVLIKGPSVLRGKCECGYETNEVMIFGVYGEI